MSSQYREQQAAKIRAMYGDATPIQKSEEVKVTKVEDADLEKGDGPSFEDLEAANDLEEDSKGDLEKGEGSRGGKVIGHTKSGKPIYANHDHEGHKDFTEDDHYDALAKHQKTKDFKKYLDDNDYDSDERDPEQWESDSKNESKDHVTHQLVGHYKKISKED